MSLEPISLLGYATAVGLELTAESGPLTALLRTAHGMPNFRHGHTVQWNTLPSSVTASETLGTFKRRLKMHLFATSFP